MGALTAVIWTLLNAGTEITADKTLYGCTFALLHHRLERFGVSTRFVDMTEAGNVAAGFGPKTRLVVTETPSNPNMRVVDNTYCTPYL